MSATGSALDDGETAKRSRDETIGGIAQETGTDAESCLAQGLVVYRWHLSAPATRFGSGSAVLPPPSAIPFDRWRGRACRRGSSRPIRRCPPGGDGICGRQRGLRLAPPPNRPHRNCHAWQPLWDLRNIFLFLADGKKNLQPSGKWRRWSRKYRSTRGLWRI